MAGLFLLLGLALSDEISHVYEAGEAVTVWVNKVNSPRTPMNFYPYSSLPLCRGQPSSPEHTHVLSVGEVIEGIEMQNTHMTVRFQQDVNQTRLCSRQLSATDREKLGEAVRVRSWLQLFVDDLLVWGRLGKSVVAEDGHSSEFVYTHIHLEIHYNNQQIVQILYKAKGPVELVSANDIQEQSLELFYSVVWLPTTYPFETRLYLYEDPGSFRPFLHWISFLFFILGMIIFGGVLDIIRGEALLADTVKEISTQGRVTSDLTGWKQVAGEVFRTPSYLLPFTACVGSGVQLLGVAVSLQLLCFLYPVYIEQMVQVLLVLYCLLALLGGLTSGSLYRKHRGHNWIIAMLASLLGIPVILTLTVLSVSSLTADLSLNTGVEVLKVFLLVAIPLHIAGTLLGRRYFGAPNSSYNVNIVQQPISPKFWFQHPLPLILLNGYVPFFFGILWEFDYLLIHFWSYKLFFTSISSPITILMLLALLTTATSLSVFCFLNSKDPRWPWFSFVSAGNTAGFQFLFFVHNYVYGANMISGEQRGSLYFGYAGLACFCSFLICGAVGYLAADKFVRIIYNRSRNN